MSFVCTDMYFKPSEVCHFQAAAKETKALCTETFPGPRVVLHLEKKNGEKKNLHLRRYAFFLGTEKLFPHFCKILEPKITHFLLRYQIQHLKYKPEGSDIYYANETWEGAKHYFSLWEK